MWAVNLYGYTIFRRGRGIENGGGVCLYVKLELKPINKYISRGSTKEGVECHWDKGYKENDY